MTYTEADRKRVVGTPGETNPCGHVDYYRTVREEASS